MARFNWSLVVRQRNRSQSVLPLSARRYMNESDVKRIEDAFNLTLPADYRHLLLHFPVRFSRGTTEQPLWDDADALISRNRELRTGRKSLGVQYHPIPEHYFLIGEDGAGWQFLIDLHEQPSIVHIMEFERVDDISPALTDDGEPQNVNNWLHSHLLELKNDGVDINSETAPEYRLGWGCILGTVAFCIVMAVAIALMVAGIQWLTSR